MADGRHFENRYISISQLLPSVWPHNTATGFRPPSATVISAEPFSHGTGTLRCCRRKWRNTDTDLCLCGETQTMSHVVESCPLTKLNGGLSRSATRCGWRRCFVADQLWLMTRIREEEVKNHSISVKFCTQQQILNWVNVRWWKMKKVRLDRQTTSLTERISC